MFVTEIALLFEDFMKYKQVPVKFSFDPSVRNNRGFVTLYFLLGVPTVLPFETMKNKQD